MAELRIPVFDDVQKAASRIGPYTPPSPLLEAPIFTERSGVRVFLKADCLLPPGSFKFRGALNALLALSGEERRHGVVAFSSGNHGQAVALAARTLGVKATIIMPIEAPRVKVENTRTYGAEVVSFDKTRERREDVARAYQEQGMRLLHPYDDPEVIAGQGVCGLEIARQMSERGAKPDEILVCTSGGGYVAGVALGVSRELPGVPVTPVETAASTPWGDSLRAGAAIEVAPKGSSICDGLLFPHPKPGAIAWTVAKERLSEGSAVNDETVLRAMAGMAKYFGLVSEPAGAVALAAVIADPARFGSKTVVATVSGRNVDMSTFARAMERTGEV